VSDGIMEIEVVKNMEPLEPQVSLGSRLVWSSRNLSLAL